VSLVAVDRSRVFANNLALFIEHHLSRHGALASVARTLNVEPAKLRRYARRRASDRELRDIEFVYQVIAALGFDPITVFSAAQRSESLATMLALAEGAIAHSLSVEFQGLTSALGGPPSSHAIDRHGPGVCRVIGADSV
jgi:hypothetical protein